MSSWKKGNGDGRITERIRISRAGFGRFGRDGWEQPAFINGMSWTKNAGSHGRDLQRSDSRMIWNLCHPGNLRFRRRWFYWFFNRLAWPTQHWLIQVFWFSWHKFPNFFFGLFPVNLSFPYLKPFSLSFRISSCQAGELKSGCLLQKSSHNSSIARIFSSADISLIFKFIFFPLSVVYLPFYLPISKKNVSNSEIK